ncbi:hypothetical protein NKJ72_11920 [Mesorhizobium sp. M0045]|uniref:hypothetical protein n=1 Tax=Mesorhizobium sp. M0045 TaxID=2956857 RepID=UPI0033364606
MVKRYRLSRDVVVRFRGDYDVTAKAGTVLEHVPHNGGLKTPGFAIPPAACDAGQMGKAGTWSIFGHDSKHFYIWAPADAVEEFDE